MNAEINPNFGSVFLFFVKIAKFIKKSLKNNKKKIKKIKIGLELSPV